MPVKLVLFPGEAHGPRKLSHQLRKTEEELAWFDKYFFKSNPPENEAFKKGSPLASRWRGGRCGRMERCTDTVWAPEQQGETVPTSTLVPETVKLGEIWVGRFEVTRAQYALFDKENKVEPGTENFPANGISFEQAKSYCKWLSQLTGEMYRLPNETEAGEL